MHALKRVDVRVPRENHEQPSIPDELAVVRGHRRPRYPSAKAREERSQRRAVRRCQRPRHVQHARVLAYHTRGHQLEGIQRASTAIGTAAVAGSTAGGGPRPEHQSHTTIDGGVVRVTRNPSLVESQHLCRRQQQQQKKRKKRKKENTKFKIGFGEGGGAGVYVV